MSEDLEKIAATAGVLFGKWANGEPVSYPRVYVFLGWERANLVERAEEEEWTLTTLGRAVASHLRKEP